MHPLEHYLKLLDEGSLSAASNIAIHAGWTPEPVLAALLERLQRPGPPSHALAGAVNSVSEKIGNLARPLLDAIAEAARRRDIRESARFQLCQALSRLEPEGATCVEALLRSDDGGLRRAMAGAIGSVGTSPGQHRACVPLLADPDPMTREEALRALGPPRWRSKEPAEIAALRPSFAPLMVPLLLDPNDRVRSAAADSLRALGAGAVAVWPELLALLASHPGPAPDVIGAANGLPDCPDPGRLLSLLGPRLGEQGASYLFAKLPGAARAALVLLDNPDPGVRTGAAAVLGEVELDHAERREAIVGLTRLTRDPEPGPRRAALHPLGKVAAHAAKADQLAAVHVATALLDDPNTGAMATFALKELAKAIPPVTTDSLARFLETQGRAAAAIDALLGASKLGDDAIATLLRVADRYPELRGPAHHVLKRKARHALPPPPDPKRSFYLLRLSTEPGGIRKDTCFVANALDEIVDALREHARDDAITLVLHNESVDLHAYDADVSIRSVDLRPLLRLRIPDVGEVRLEADGPKAGVSHDRLCEILDGCVSPCPGLELDVDLPRIAPAAPKAAPLAMGEVRRVKVAGRRREIQLGWNVGEN